MTLTAGGFLHPSLFPAAFRLRNPSLHRNSLQHPPHYHYLSSIQSFYPSELLRFQSLRNFQQCKGVRNVVEDGTELEGVVSQSDEGEMLLYLTPERQSVISSREIEEQQVSEALESVKSQPWRTLKQDFVKKTDRQSEEEWTQVKELVRGLDSQVGVRNSRTEGWRALGTSSSELTVKQLRRPFSKRQFRRKDQPLVGTEEVSPRFSASNSAFVNKVDMKESVDAVESSSQRGDGNGDVSRGDEATRVSQRDGDGGEATGESARFSKSAVSLVGEPGKPYQRLSINLDLQLYWARTLRQRGLYDQAATLLGQCIRDWPDDGRPYVALGTLLKRQNKMKEARRVFEDGCQAVRGENAYIWQAWAVLEDRNGNTRKARKLFDAATVADKTHAAAWHAWAVLELREGNSKKARALLKKGLKFHGPNEYLLQTLACIEVKLGRYEQARSLFGKATRANPKSAASWLAWALMEASQDCKTTARNLFKCEIFLSRLVDRACEWVLRRTNFRKERFGGFEHLILSSLGVVNGKHNSPKSGVEASPKNRYVWQAWALFEAKDGNKERARQLFQRGQELNPKDPVLFQSFALFEYDCGHLAIARALFKRGIAVDPQHQPVWIAWAWVEWKEGNLDVARELFQRAIAVDSRTMDAVRAFQAWGILEDREGNVGVARVLFKRALRVDSQNVPTWMSWAAMEERQGNAVRADELRNLCLQQRTEVVDEAPWDENLNNMLAPAIDKIKGFLKLEQGFPWSRSEDERAPPMDPETAQALETSRLEEEFDVDGFLSDKFPGRYGDQAGQQERRKSKVASKRQQTLTDNALMSKTS